MPDLRERIEEILKAAYNHNHRHFDVADEIICEIGKCKNCLNSEAWPNPTGKGKDTRFCKLDKGVWNDDDFCSKFEGNKEEI